MRRITGGRIRLVSDKLLREEIRTAGLSMSRLTKLMTKAMERRLGGVEQFILIPGAKREEK